MRTSGEIKRAVEEEERDIQIILEPKGSKVSRPTSLSTTDESDTAVIDCTDVTPMLTKLSSKNDIVALNTKNTITDKNVVPLVTNSTNKMQSIVRKKYDNGKPEKSVSFLDNYDAKVSVKSVISLNTDDVIRYTNKINILNNINNTNRKNNTHPVSILKPPKHPVIIPNISDNSLPNKNNSHSKQSPVIEMVSVTDNSAQTDISYNVKTSSISASKLSSMSTNNVSCSISTSGENLISNPHQSTTSPVCQRPPEESVNSFPLKSTQCCNVSCNDGSLNSSQCKEESSDHFLEQNSKSHQTITNEKIIGSGTQVVYHHTCENCFYI